MPGFMIPEKIMFHHQGHARTYKHNTGIASLLSFVAGLVNVAGFLAVQRLTTNVTGHFAYFADEFFKLNFSEGFVYFLYIFFFFLGSFTSAFLIEIITRKNDKYVYVIPVIIESLILITVALTGKYYTENNPDIIAFSLLFAMGLQNSLVTSISNAMVRTTHLTGLFTDLGIEISQLFFYRTKEQKLKLHASIKLRLIIISMFFTGGVVGGIFYSQAGISVLLIAAGVLIAGIVFDSVKIKTNG